MSDATKIPASPVSTKIISTTPSDVGNKVRVPLGARHTWNATITRQISIPSSLISLSASNVNISNNIQHNSSGDRELDNQTVTALDVAHYFLNRVDREAGDTISALKLQKLVYYAQAWSLALKNQALFPEEIEAWVHGPAVRRVWEAYKDYKFQSIPQFLGELPVFTEDQEEVLEEVWNAYGDLGAKQLEQLTHSEPPWLAARKGLDPGEKSQNVISLEDMRSYYASLLVRDSAEEE